MTPEHESGIRARVTNPALTKGPWLVWNGPEFVGGGADLCIGAGERWLLNMDHRAVEERFWLSQMKANPNYVVDSRGFSEQTKDFEFLPECDIATLATCEDRITAEQRANAEFMAAAREDVPALLAALDEARAELARMQNAHTRA